MKRILQYAAAAVLTLCLCVLLGGGLLILVYRFPTEEMKNNVQRSTQLYDYEGVYPQLITGYKMSQLDNCTDATMLLNAIYPSGDMCDAMIVPRTEYYDRNPVDSLTDYASDVEGETYSVGYPRYWHGYLVIIKPLLLFFDVGDIRVFSLFILFGLLLAIILLMQKERKCYLLPFATAVLLLDPLVFPVSFQFSAVGYITLFLTLLVLRKKAWSEAGRLFMFFGCGIATAYFDFLTFPLVGLYFPMIFMLMREASWRRSVKLVILGSLSWIVGYGGMWAGKWLLGSVITGQNIFADALYRAGEYSNMQYDEGTVSHMQVIFKNVQVLLRYPILFLAIAVLAWYIWRFVRSRETLKVSYIEALPFLLIAAAPVCWYVALGTHSYIHYWFTYRNLCVSVFAVLTGLVKVLGLHKAEKAILL